jgi:hypothetical protein
VGGDSDPEYTDRQLYGLHTSSRGAPAAVLAGTGGSKVGKVSLRHERLMETTEENTRPHVAFYVALTDDACQNISLIRSLKASFAKRAGCG